MKNKEQLLYFFLQGKISLSQYDYKFMANLQTMIQNQSRVTSNQATLFDNLISKYKKQLTKNGFIKEELKQLPWKTMIVESTPEFTGAVVSIIDDKINLKVPFNKTFINEFRNIKHNNFEWIKETKTYLAPFSTSNLKILVSSLPKYFTTVRYDDELQAILDELKHYEGSVWNPTLTSVNGRLIVGAINPVLADIIKDIPLEATPETLFKLSQLGIDMDPNIYSTDKKLEFAASRVYEVEITEIETMISWMKNIGCDNVIIGRGLRNDGIENIVEKYEMMAAGPLSYGTLPDGVSILIQSISNVDSRNAFLGTISKTVVLKDSRPIEVK